MRVRRSTSELHTSYHGGGQTISVVCSEDVLRIFLWEKYKDSLWDSSKVISNVCRFGICHVVHPHHDLIHLVDEVTLHHHHKAPRWIFKCHK